MGMHVDMLIQKAMGFPFTVPTVGMLGLNSRLISMKRTALHEADVSLEGVRLTPCWKVTKRCWLGNCKGPTQKNNARGIHSICAPSYAGCF